MIAKPAAIQIETMLNMGLYQSYTVAVLFGDSTSSIFPRVKIEKTDEDDKYVFLSACVLANPDDREGTLTAEITFDLSTGSYGYGLFVNFSPFISRGELIDPGGWEIDENSYKGPFTSIMELAKSMKADLNAKAAQSKAEAESEKDLEGSMNYAPNFNSHRPYPEYCPICRGDCLYDAKPESI